MKLLRRRLMLLLITVALLQPGCEFVAGSVFGFRWAVYTQFLFVDGVDYDVGLWQWQDDFYVPQGYGRIRTRLWLPNADSYVMPDSMTTTYTRENPLGNVLDTMSVWVELGKNGKGKRKRIPCPGWSFNAGDYVRMRTRFDGQNVPIGSRINFRNSYRFMNN